MTDPRVPPEIEREIFIYAVESRIQDAPNLFLIAKRVREWLLPIVFKVVIISRFRSFPIPFNDISQFQEYGHHIRSLLITNTFQAGKGPSQIQQSLKDSLTQCPNITNLALWWRDPPVQIESLMILSNLTHLSMPAFYLVHLITGLDPCTFHPDHFGPLNLPASTGPPLFQNVTHLDTLEAEWLPWHCDGYLTPLASHFPELTHIAYTMSAWRNKNETLLRLTLQRFKKLEVLVLWKLALGAAEIEVHCDAEIMTQIVAVQTMWMRDWEYETRGIGLGMWEFADWIVRERKKKKVVAL